MSTLETKVTGKRNVQQLKDDSASDSEADTRTGSGEDKSPIILRVAEASSRLSPQLIQEAHALQSIIDSRGLRLILHFDLNNTLLLLDSTSGHESLAGTVAETLSKCALGLAVRTHRGTVWGGYAENPFVSRGLANEISWYEFQRRIYSSDAVLKPKAAAFIKTDGSYLQKEFDIMLKQGEDIFVSFYIVRQLFSKALYVFRSFGKDIALFAKKLEDSCAIDSADDLTICRSHKGIITIPHETCERHMLPPMFVEEYLLKDAGQFTAVKEDFDWWKLNGKSAQFGKFVCGMEGAFQIGFDDLDCMEAQGPNAYVHRISTVAAASNPEYFVRLIIDTISKALM